LIQDDTYTAILTDYKSKTISKDGESHSVIEFDIELEIPINELGKINDGLGEVVTSLTCEDDSWFSKLPCKIPSRAYQIIFGPNEVSVVERTEFCSIINEARCAKYVVVLRTTDEEHRIVYVTRFRFQTTATGVNATSIVGYHKIGAYCRLILLERGLLDEE